jgi:hypothetical protein
MELPKTMSRKWAARRSSLGDKGTKKMAFQIGSPVDIGLLWTVLGISLLAPCSELHLMGAILAADRLTIYAI